MGIKTNSGVTQGAGQFKNPYPSRLVSGQETNRDRLIWQEGYDTHARMMQLVAAELKHMAHEMDIALQDVCKMKYDLTKEDSK